MQCSPVTFAKRWSTTAPDCPSILHGLRHLRAGLRLLWGDLKRPVPQRRVGHATLLLVSEMLRLVEPQKGDAMNRYAVISRWLWGLLLGVTLVPNTLSAEPGEDGKLRIICFGAHPDDAEFKVGGTGILWARQGHHVKLVSVTNGDIGHWQMAGGELAQRRTAEVQEAAKILGTTAEVLDIHDGELLPTLEHRRDDRAADPQLEGRHRDLASTVGLPSGSPLRRRAGAGCGLHGDRAVLLSRHAAVDEEPGVPVFE